MEGKLELRFKGARDYLQGPDMYNALFGWLTTSGGYPSPRDIDVSFHKIVSTQPKVMRLDAVPAETKPAVSCAFKSPNGRERFVLVETDVPVTERYPYDEDALVREMAIDVGTKRGTLRGPQQPTAMEVWVAMTKAVHLKVFDPKKKWLFVRARFPEYLERLGPGEWTTTIAGNFGERLTRSEIACDGVKVGEIYFSPKVSHAGN